MTLEELYSHFKYLDRNNVEFFGVHLRQQTEGDFKRNVVRVVRHQNCFAMLLPNENQVALCNRGMFKGYGLLRRPHLHAMNVTAKCLHVLGLIDQGVIDQINAIVKSEGERMRFDYVSNEAERIGYRLVKLAKPKNVAIMGRKLTKE